MCSFEICGMSQTLLDQKLVFYTEKTLNFDHIFQDFSNVSNKNSKSISMQWYVLYEVSLDHLSLDSEIWVFISMVLIVPRLDKDVSRFMKNSTELTKKCMHICTTILFLSFEQAKS